MLSDLKFCMGAVSKKGILPALTHFRISDKTVRSYNGTLALCAPLDLDLDCTPKAEPLYKAIQSCDDRIQLTLTPTNKLSVRSGGFRALIECITEPTPHAQPEGERIEINGDALLLALKKVEPFIGDDASRPWSNGVLLRDNSAYATNNVIIVQYWIGEPFPVPVNVPEVAIREMLRIDEAPIFAQLSSHMITFHYISGRWIQCHLLSAKWPDIETLLSNDCDLKPCPEGMFTALEKLKPFVDKIGRVYFKDGEMRTQLDGLEGASYAMDGLPENAIFNIIMLGLLDGVIETIDFSMYPKPCMFRGPKLRGAIVGIKI